MEEKIIKLKQDIKSILKKTDLYDNSINYPSTTINENNENYNSDLMIAERSNENLNFKNKINSNYDFIEFKKTITHSQKKIIEKFNSF